VKFEQANYWKGRISGDIDLSKVGHRSLGSKYNEWIYRRRLEVLSTWVDQDTRGAAFDGVLELGCGSGVYLDFWSSKGATKVAGVDVSPDSVSALAARYPQHRFVQADIASLGLDLGGPFQYVSIFDVLYHIVDDEAATRALKNAAGQLSPDGALLIFDQILPREYQLTQHVKFRSKAHFNKMLDAAGLTLSKKVPLFVLLEPPLVSSRSINLAIAGMYYSFGLLFRLAPPIGNLAGRLLYRLDQTLIKKNWLTENHCLYVVRRKMEI
jgi:SAM-dependent methyltransferase